MIIGLPIVIISIVIPIALISMIITAASKKNKDDISNVEHSIRNIYLYTILIVLILLLIIGSIYAVRVGLDVLLPKKQYNSNSYYSLDSYDKISKNENIVNLFTSISLVLVSIPLFIKHSKLAKETKK